MVSIDRGYLAKADEFYESAQKGNGENRFQDYNEAGKSYDEAGDSVRDISPERAAEAYQRAIDSFEKAQETMPDRRAPGVGINRTQLKLDDLENAVGNDAVLGRKRMNLSIVIGALGAFSLVFLANGITGNVVGSSGNHNTNLAIGIVLLLVAVIATRLLSKKPNVKKPIKKKPAKKKKPTKTKAKKKKK